MMGLTLYVVHMGREAAIEAARLLGVPNPETHDTRSTCADLL
jgi:hypothetical protein